MNLYRDSACQEDQLAVFPLLSWGDFMAFSYHKISYQLSLVKWRDTDFAFALFVGLFEGGSVLVSDLCFLGLSPTLISASAS
jgi:hypothetical protein